MLAAAAGAQIASQLYNLVHQLQFDAAIGPIVSIGGGGRSLDALAFIEAFRGILFYGVLLAGLAAIVGLIATRAAAAWRPRSSAQ